MADAPDRAEILCLVGHESDVTCIENVNQIGWTFRIADNTNSLVQKAVFGFFRPTAIFEVRPKILSHDDDVRLLLKNLCQPDVLHDSFRDGERDPSAAALDSCCAALPTRIGLDFDPADHLDFIGHA